MKKSMREITIVTTDSGVMLSQPDGQNDYDPCVEIAFEQIDFIIEWLTEAKSESQKIYREGRPRSSKP